MRRAAERSAERLRLPQPLGKTPSFKFTLYTPPRVGASLALEGGVVKLNLSSFGYTPTSVQGTKDNYMGFMTACRSRSRACLLYTSPSPRDRTRTRMPSSA